MQEPLPSSARLFRSARHMRLLGIACLLSALLHLGLVWSWPQLRYPVAADPLELHIELRGPAHSNSIGAPDSQANARPVQSNPTAASAQAVAASAAPRTELVRVLSTATGRTIVTRAPLLPPRIESPRIQTLSRPAQFEAPRANLLPSAATPSTTTQLAAIEHARVLQRWLESFQHYPRAARRAGLHGEVQLSFQLLRNGQARAVKIVSSSGVAILDRAATELVQRASPLPWPEQLHAAMIEIEVPVRYRLEASTTAVRPLP